MDIFEFIKNVHLPYPMRFFAKLLSWLKVILSPIQTLYNKSILFFNDIIAQVKYNSQVIYLERVLNDRFDPILRRIYIDDPIQTAFTLSVLYRKNENQPTLKLYRTTETYTKSEAIFRRNEVTEVDFTVFVPADILSQKQDDIKVNVNFYRIASMIFDIKPI